MWMAAVVPLVLAACADNLSTSPTARTRLSSDRTASDIAPSSLWADQVEGTTANGAIIDCNFAAEFRFRPC
jgi:hypothetical protein